MKMDNYKISENFQGGAGCKMISPHHSHLTNGVRPSDSLIVYPNRLSRKLLLSEIEERRERSFRAALVVLESIGDETCISVLRDVVAKEDVDWVRERAKESLVKIQKRMTKGEDAH